MILLLRFKKNWLNSVKNLILQNTTLRKNGIQIGQNQSLSTLLRIRQYVLTQNRISAKPLFTAIRITYALNIFEAHGVTSFLKFCDRTKAKKGVGIKDLFEKDLNFMRAIELANFAKSQGIEHSKLPKLQEILSSVKDKVLIFTSLYLVLHFSYILHVGILLFHMINYSL